MFLCLKLLRIEISRSVVLGMPSSSTSSLIFFKATISPVSSSFALYLKYILFKNTQHHKFLHQEVFLHAYILY